MRSETESLAGAQPQSGAMFIDHAKIEITRRAILQDRRSAMFLPPINWLRGIEGSLGSINISCLTALEARSLTHSKAKSKRRELPALQIRGALRRERVSSR